MQSTVISEMESMTSVKRMAYVFGKMGYNINKHTLYTNLSEDLISGKKIAVISQWSQLTTYDSAFQIYGLIFKRGSLLKKYMKIVMDELKKKNIRPLVCFTDQESVIFSSIKDIRVEEGNIIQETIFLPISNESLTDAQKLIIAELRARSHFSPRALADYVSDTIYLASNVKEAFNNNAVFAEHYLRNRIMDESEWEIDITKVLDEIKTILIDNSPSLYKFDEKDTYENIIIPILHLLGYENIVKLVVDDEYRIMFANPDEPKNILSICHVKYWGRPLDRVLINDPNDRIKNINPIFEIVGELL